MDNQHKQIKNYRELNTTEINLMNELKEKEQEIFDIIQRIVDLNTTIDNETFLSSDPARWLSIGQDDIERGFMALIRAVAKPLNYSK